MKKSKARYKGYGAFRGVLIVVVSIILGVSIYSWNASTLAHNNVPMPFGYGASIVLSGSMEPELNVNDLIVLHTQGEYKINDVVVYQGSNELIVHRIIAADGDSLITKGDANNVADEPVSPDAIKGKVIFHIHGVGAIVNLLKTPIAVFIVILTAVLLIELSFRHEQSSSNDDIEKIKEEIRKLREKEE